MNLRLYSHGGACCGRKHIYGFNRTARSPDSEWPDRSSKDYRSNLGAEAHRNVFHGPAPYEPMLDRLKRLLSYGKKVWPGNVVEITLAGISIGDYDQNAYVGSVNQITEWEPILLDLGFKIVYEFVNSNSNRTVKVFMIEFRDIDNKKLVVKETKKEKALR